MLLLTVMVKVSLSVSAPVPSSVTVTVTDGVSPTWAPVGVQLKTPVLASMLMPRATEAASRLKLNVSTGRSLSLAVAVNVRFTNSVTL